MTQRQSSRSGQQGAFCGSTTGAGAWVHGPVGLSLVATPIAAAPMTASPGSPGVVSDAE
jgi:hypothetical protein